MNVLATTRQGPIAEHDTFKDALINLPTVIWTGAGFSRCATLGSAPLMCDFFKNIERSHFPHLVKFLEKNYGDIETANVEEILRTVDQIQDSPLAQNIRRDLMANQDPRKIRHELLRYCLKRLELPGVPMSWVAQFLACATERTTVITTNYDTIAEQILTNRKKAIHCGPAATCHHCNMMAILRENCSCDPAVPAWKPKNAPLLKLHGSICWHVCRNSACINANCLVPECNGTVHTSPKCNCCSEENDPVIVLPSMQKTFKDYPQLQRMWDFADQALKSMHIFVVFGFSFPESDCLIRDLVCNAINNSTLLREILVVDVNTASVAAKLRKMVAKKPNVQIRELLVPYDGSAPEWAADWAQEDEINVKCMTG